MASSFNALTTGARTACQAAGEVVGDDDMFGDDVGTTKLGVHGLETGLKSSSEASPWRTLSWPALALKCSESIMSSLTPRSLSCAESGTKRRYANSVCFATMPFFTAVSCGGGDEPFVGGDLVDLFLAGNHDDRRWYPPIKAVSSRPR